MLKILIVDDEPFFLDFLAGMLAWEDYGAVVTGTASNGLKALEALSAEPADVVITDIKMPVMDGLELICETLERYPQTQFVVLSAYNEFHMVEEAFKLGVKDYLMKPEVTKEQIVSILGKCERNKREHEALRQKKREQEAAYERMHSRLEYLERMLSASQPVMKKTLLNTIIDRGESLDALTSSQAGALGLALRPQVMMLLKIDDFTRVIEDVWKNDRQSFEFAVTKLLEEIVSGEDGAVVFCRVPDEYAVLISGTRARTPGDVVGALHSAVSDGLQKLLRIDTIAAVSSLENAPVSLSGMYAQAKAAMERFFIKGKRAPLYYDAAPPSVCYGADFEQAMKERALSFSRNLQSGDLAALRESLGAYRVPAEQVGVQAISQVRRLFSKYHFYIREYLDQHGSSDRADALTARYTGYLSGYGTLSEYDDWLESVVTVLRQMDFSSTNLVKRVKRYILAHYSEELFLGALASRMGVNPSYLSRCFSNAEGEGLSAYINRVRIQAALRLLENAGARVYEVSDQVGYKNVEHFSRMFKKVVGKSPSDYIKSR